MDALMQIGQAAEWVGLPEKTIRYYEGIGLVSPLRAENGFRLFRKQDIQSLIVVKGARGLGFSIEDSRSLLTLYKNQDRTSADVKLLATKQLEETREKIAQLRSLEKKLEYLTDRCRGNEEPDCPILDFLVRYQ